MISKLPKDFKSIILQNNGLSLYLANLQTGKPATKRSWLYENLEPDAILDKWQHQLSSLRDGTEFQREVFQFDTSQLSKWGPQGEVAPMKDLLELVQAGFSDSSNPQAFSDPDWQRAKDEIAEKFHSFKLRPASYSHVVDDMRARDTLESNSGWPLFTRRNKPEVVSQSIEDASNGAWAQYPAIALFRNYNQKTRLVWMYPMSVNVKEGSYLQPLQSRIIRLANTQGSDPFWRTVFSPWIGFNAVRDVMTNAYADRNLNIDASDFTATDEHFTFAHTYEVYDVISHAYQRAVREGLLESLRYMHNIPLIISEDEMIIGEHGVSSGSNWTNFVETIFDTIFSRYVEIKLGREIRFSPVIGDDMSWLIPGEYDEEFAEKLEELGEQAGHIINASKTTNFPNKVKFLQRLFQRGYKSPEGQVYAVYSTIRALKSLVYPEKMYKKKLWSSDMFCARTYMILENCVDHPLFTEFVEFVVRGQKDLIAFAKKSAPELSQIQKKAKLLPGLNPTYNTEKRDSSLSEFASIQIARKL